ncbi:MAG: Asp-tRNA(Asn)/Glu-tRNA(Gln) amidotransferase subunit GatA [Candidatus Kerfeldbacteria bacterium]
MSKANLSSYTGAALHRGLSEKTFTLRDVVKAYVKEIDAGELKVRSFLHIDREGARAGATAIDAAHQSGESLPPLAGFIIAVKDNIAVSGMPATAASKILEGYMPPYEATAVTRLRKAGAIIIGKTNLDEFAMGVSTEQSAYQVTTNPKDSSRVPGGSSGGSAAAVAANFCTAALGTDTGGSVRQPAAFCGIVGMRPTYGAVSRNGLIALASSLDVVGTLTRTVEDARMLLKVMVGYDPTDATSLPHLTIPSRSPTIDLTRVRIGVPREYLEGLQDDTVRRGFDRMVQRARKLGATLTEVSLPTTPYAVPTYYIIVPAEASSNLARYDGIRFGHPGDRALGHRRVYAAMRGERFGLEPLRRIAVGTFTLSEGYADRYYHAAQRMRTRIREDFQKAFRDVDMLMTPTTPCVAFPLQSMQRVIDRYLQDIFLSAASLAGLPAISIPSESESIPVGVQCIGAVGSDDAVMAIAKQLSTGEKS